MSDARQPSNSGSDNSFPYEVRAFGEIGFDDHEIMDETRSGGALTPPTRPEPVRRSDVSKSTEPTLELPHLLFRKWGEGKSPWYLLEETERGTYNLLSQHPTRGAAMKALRKRLRDRKQA